MGLDPLVFDLIEPSGDLFEVDQAFLERHLFGSCTSVDYPADESTVDVGTSLG
jgi:hypothetical protein